MFQVKERADLKVKIHATCQSPKNALQQDRFEANNPPKCEEPSCLHWLSWNETAEQERTLRFPKGMHCAITETFQRGQVLPFVTLWWLSTTTQLLSWQSSIRKIFDVFLAFFYCSLAAGFKESQHPAIDLTWVWVSNTCSTNQPWVLQNMTKRTRAGITVFRV